MRQYLLTRSAYSRSLPIDRNHARLALLQGVTARSLAAQTQRDVTWLVLLDPSDPLLEPRKEAIRSAGLPVMFAPAGRLIRTSRHDKPAGPWSRHVDWSDAVLTSRLDDDDALAPDALASVRLAAEACPESAVWVFGSGWWVVRGRAELRRDPLAPFSSLFAPLGDRRTIMDAHHALVGRLAPVREAAAGPAWMWVRHAATRSLRARPDQIGRAHV